MMAEPGIWTPMAEVLCYNCCRNAYPNAAPTGGQARDVPVTCRCDGCGQAVYPNYSGVEIEANLRDELNDHWGREVARMRQTGGMCSALEVPLAEGHYLLLVDDERWRDPDPLNPRFLVSLWRAEEDEDCLLTVPGMWRKESLFSLIWQFLSGGANG